jgi:hypothetical protein
VLLRSYLHWGRDCVDHLNGMFAFGLWDGRRQELLPGAMSIRPSATTPAALLLDINRWLAKSGVTIR